MFSCSEEARLSSCEAKNQSVWNCGTQHFWLFGLKCWNFTNFRYLVASNHGAFGLVLKFRCPWIKLHRKFVQYWQWIAARLCEPPGFGLVCLATLFCSWAYILAFARWSNTANRKEGGRVQASSLSFFFFFFFFFFFGTKGDEEKKARKGGRLSGESGTRRWRKEGEGKEERRREKRKKRSFFFFFAFRWSSVGSCTCTGILATGRKQTKMASKLSALGQSFIPWSNDKPLSKLRFDGQSSFRAPEAFVSRWGYLNKKWTLPSAEYPWHWKRDWTKVHGCRKYLVGTCCGQQSMNVIWTSGRSWCSGCQILHAWANASAQPGLAMILWVGSGRASNVLSENVHLGEAAWRWKNTSVDQWNANTVSQVHLTRRWQIPW